MLLCTPTHTNTHRQASKSDKGLLPDVSPAPSNATGASAVVTTGATGASSTVHVKRPRRHDDRKDV